MESTIVINAVKEFLSSILTPAIVVSIVSALVGAFIAFITYRLNRQRKEFDTLNHIRQVLTDLFEFDRRIADELALTKCELAGKLPVSNFNDVQNTTELLVRIHEVTAARAETDLDAPLRATISRATNLHYYNQSHRTLLIHSVEDLLGRYENLLNNYEKYVAYHSMIVSTGIGKEKMEYWYKKARVFYEDMKGSKDYSNMIRIGISLVGVEIDGDYLHEAANRLAEIGDKSLWKGANLDLDFINRKIELQRKRLNHCVLFGPKDRAS